MLSIAVKKKFLYNYLSVNDSPMICSQPASQLDVRQDMVKPAEPRKNPRTVYIYTNLVCQARCHFVAVVATTKLLKQQWVL